MSYTNARCCYCGHTLIGYLGEHEGNDCPKNQYLRDTNTLLSCSLCNKFTTYRTTKECLVAKDTPICNEHCLGELMARELEKGT